ncbi:hypothetical protein RQP46_006223 [Phenoliferia psychrophenolica]
MSEVQHFHVTDFATDHGGILPAVQVAYKVDGTLSADRKTVLVSTCFGETLSGSNPLIGVGKALDPEKYFIVRVGLFGGSDSSSASNTAAPHDGERFPRMSYSDNCRAFRLLLESLGVVHLYAVIGFSMGGGVAYTFGTIHGDYVDRIVCLATSAQTSLHNVAFLEGPKAALKASGEYAPGSKGPRAFGRCYCAWAYSHDWFEQKKWEEGGKKGSATSLSEHFKNWENSMGGWNGYDLRTLSWTWQNASIARATRVAGGAALHTSLIDALKAMQPKALIMPTRTDQYFVPADSEMEVSHLRDGKLVVVETIYGHVGGGGGGSKEDNDFIDAEVAKFLAI